MRRRRPEQKVVRVRVRLRMRMVQKSLGMVMAEGHGHGWIRWRRRRRMCGEVRVSVVRMVRVRIAACETTLVAQSTRSGCGHHAAGAVVLGSTAGSGQRRKVRRMRGMRE